MVRQNGGFNRSSLLMHYDDKLDRTIINNRGEFIFRILEANGLIAKSSRHTVEVNISYRDDGITTIELDKMVDYEFAWDARSNIILTVHYDRLVYRIRLLGNDEDNGRLKLLRAVFID